MIVNFKSLNSNLLLLLIVLTIMPAPAGATHPPYVRPQTTVTAEKNVSRKQAQNDVRSRIETAGYGEQPTQLKTKKRLELVLNYIFMRSGVRFDIADIWRNPPTSIVPRNPEQLAETISCIVVDGLRSLTPEQETELLNIVKSQNGHFTVGRNDPDAVRLLTGDQIAAGVVAVRRKIPRNVAVSWLRPHAEGAVRHAAAKFARAGTAFHALTQGGTQFHPPEAVFVVYHVLSGDYASFSRHPENPFCAGFPFQFLLTPEAMQKLCDPDTTDHQTEKAPPKPLLFPPKATTRQEPPGALSRSTRRRFVAGHPAVGSRDARRSLDGRGAKRRQRPRGAFKPTAGYDVLRTNAAPFPRRPRWLFQPR